MLSWRSSLKVSGLTRLRYQFRFCLRTLIFRISLVAFVTQLNLVDMEDDVHAGKRNLLSFDATELSKMDMITKNCSQTGETLQFDIIKREGYDEIMETVANQTSSQSEAFATSQRDTMEALDSVTK